VAKSDRTRWFLSRLYTILRDKTKGGNLSPDDFQAAVKAARAHAGGKVKNTPPADRAAAQASESGPLYSREALSRVFSDQADMLLASEATYPDLAPFFAAEIYADGVVTLPVLSEPVDTLSEDMAEGEADDEHTTLMIGYLLPATFAQQLAVPGGEPPEDLHITLCFCGELSELDPWCIAQAMVAVQGLAREMGPMKGKISGVGRFLGDDGMDAVYASVDVEGLSALRAMVRSRLAACGVPVATDHDFNPHVTLKYVPTGEDAGNIAVEPLPFQVDNLTVFQGNQRFTQMLTGQPYPRVDPYPVPVLYSDVALLSARQANQTVQDGPRLVLKFSQQYMEPPAWIPMIPAPSEHTHPLYGKIKITEEGNAKFVENFGNYQPEGIPIDLQHDVKYSGAAGWIRELRQNLDGSVSARVDWNDRGRTALVEDRYQYISPEWFDKWTDSMSGEDYENVLIGAALTNRPFFKTLAIKPLVATEDGAFVETEEELMGAKVDTETMDKTEKTETETPNQTEVRTETETHETRTETPAPNQTQAPAPGAVAMSEEALNRRFAEMESRLVRAEQAEREAKAAQEKAASDLASAQGRLKEMDAEARRKRFAEMVRGDGGENRRWFGEVDKNVDILVTLAETFGEESDQFKAFVEREAATAKALYESSAMTEKGTSQPGSPSEDTAEGRVFAEARKLMAEEKGLSEPMAIQRALDADPKLYAEYRAERGRAR
jgi:2'-5' RNA ligase